MSASETQHPPEAGAYESSARQSQANPQTLVGKIMAIGGVLVSLVFLANLTFGIIPLEIPDNLPLVGNLDEVFFTGVLLTSLGYLGIPLIPNFRAAATPLRIDGPKR
jgi:hypothetical protein